MSAAATPLDHVTVCAACRDPEAAPRAVRHESGNPWLSRLVCDRCGAGWEGERVRRAELTARAAVGTGVREEAAEAPPGAPNAETLAADAAWCREQEREERELEAYYRDLPDHIRGVDARANYGRAANEHASHAARYARLVAALEVLDAVERRMTRAECLEPESDAWAWLVNVRPDVEEPPDEGQDYGGATFREAMAAALAPVPPAGSVTR